MNYELLGEALCSLSWFSVKLVPIFAENASTVACVFEFQLLLQNAFLLTSLKSE